ncbi:MAG: XisI protein [Coleofasciculus sp. S288]|nr:XisI protein [Coleofasciculus sp. S288]
MNATGAQECLLPQLQPSDLLVAMEVPREDIVLGLQPPYKRQYTEYGVA